QREIQTMDRGEVIEVNASPPVHQTPYELALSFMPILLFLVAVMAIVKGWSWIRDRAAKEIKSSAVIESRLDDLEKTSRDIIIHTEKLNNHETRLTIIETNNAHINTTLGELKSDIKQLNDNVMKLFGPKKPS